MSIQPAGIDDDDHSTTRFTIGPRGAREGETTRTPLTSALFGAARRFSRLESWIAATLRRVSLPLLRGSLAVVYIWFGALKLAGLTPVADLVAASVPWVDPAWFIPILGLVEIILGLALLLGRFLTMIGLVLVAHLGGTFLVLLMQPELAFQHGNPMLLTTIGEFVVKNVVLASAAIAIAAWSGTARTGSGSATPNRIARTT